MSTPILIGEANPYGSPESFALADFPAGCAGENLRRRILGVTSDRYMSWRRHNLCPRDWSMKVASARAAELERLFVGETLVLLGRKVATAFAFPTETPFFSSHVPKPEHAFLGPSVARFICLPHPSGLCREWGDPGAVERARGELRHAFPDIPFGEADGAPRTTRAEARASAKAAIIASRLAGRPCTNCGKKKTGNDCPDCGFDLGEHGAYR